MAVAIMSAPVDQPPSYSSASPSYAQLQGDSFISRVGSSQALPSPQYSPTATRSELVIDAQSLAGSSNSSNREYNFACRSLELNLGPIVWGTSIPVFGCNGVIEGSAILQGDTRIVSSVALKLDGKLTSTFTERGLVTGAATTQLASVTIIMSPSQSGEWSSPMAFSIPFPAYALGRQSRLPSSLVTYQPGVTSEVRYTLKATVSRKGLRRNDSLKIPLLYFPRSFARAPPLHSIPEPVINTKTSAVLTTEPELIRVMQLEPKWPQKSSSNTRCLSSAVFLTLPTTLSFALEENIPLALTIITPSSPAVAKILSSSAKIQLIKRTQFFVKNGKLGGKFDFPVGNAEVSRVDDSREGLVSLFCGLKSELKSTLASWCVTDVVKQQYLIRAAVQPASTVAAHVPSFSIEQDIELCTDAFDGLEHENLPLRSFPSPAASLISQHIADTVSGRGISGTSFASSTYSAIR